MIETIQNFLLNLTREDIGAFSTICLTLCSFSLVFNAFRDGHCKGVPGLFIWIWFLGDVSGCFYVFPLNELPLNLNYGLNTIMASIMLYYKIRRN